MSESTDTQPRNLIPMTDEQRERNRERLMERVRNGDPIIQL